MNYKKLQVYFIASATGFLSALAGMALFLRLAGYPVWVERGGTYFLEEKVPFYTETTSEGYSEDSSIVNVAAYKPITEKELSALSLQQVYNQVAEMAIPGVVSIQVTSNAGGRGSQIPNQQRQFFGDDFLQKFFGQRPNNGQRPNAPERKVSSSGSGFVVNKEGYVVSNYHVVKDAASIIVFFNDSNKEYEAKVIGVDPDTDIALLKIDSKEDFPFLVLGNSDLVKTGDIAIAIGNPFGLSHTFTTGVISAKGRTGIANKYENFIQTDTVINPGNSGGPLLNMKGEVIGINSNILSQTRSSIGLGFSIPINMAKAVVEELRATGKVVRGWLGIYYGDVTKEVADALEIENRGVIVQRVLDGSPAAEAGIEGGDIIGRFNNKVLRNGKDLLFQMSKVKVGATIPIEILRKGKKITKRVKLREQQQASIEASTVPEETEGRNVNGVVVRDMTSSDLKTYGRPRAFGVIITDLTPNSPLTYYGISSGDVIEAVNKKPTPTVKAFEAVVGSIKKNNKVLFKIRSGDSVYYIVSKL